MKNEFIETTTGTHTGSNDDLDMAIFNEGRDQLVSHDVALITVRTVDEVFFQVKEHHQEKIVIICSGTVGRCLVPEIFSKHPTIHNIYIFAHNIELHMDWTIQYIPTLKVFDFPTDLLVRLTRDISSYFIEQGKIFLEVNDPSVSLTFFRHAQKLEIEANIRNKMKPNTKAINQTVAQMDFRDNLDLLEGKDGLISKAEAALRNEGGSTQPA